MRPSRPRRVFCATYKGQLYLLPEHRPAKFERVDQTGLHEAGYGPDDRELKRRYAELKRRYSFEGCRHTGGGGSGPRASLTRPENVKRGARIDKRPHASGHDEYAS
jgi:hypothetical protein